MSKYKSHRDLAVLALMTKVKEAIRSPYVFPGGYPLSVILTDSEAMCPACAKASFRQITHATLAGWGNTGWAAASVDVIWEGDFDCVLCGKALEAYPSDERMRAETNPSTDKNNAPGTS